MKKKKLFVQKDTIKQRSKTKDRTQSDIDISLVDGIDEENLRTLLSPKRLPKIILWHILNLAM